MKKDKKKIDWLKVLEKSLIVFGVIFGLFCFYMAIYSYMYEHSLAYFNAVYDYIDAVSNYFATRFY